MSTLRAWSALSLTSLLIIAGCSDAKTLPNVNASTVREASPPRSIEFVFKTLADPNFGSTYCEGIDDRGVIAAFVRKRGVKGVRIDPPYQHSDFHLYAERTVFLGFRGNLGDYGYRIGAEGVVTGFTRRNGLFTIYREDKSPDTEVTGIYDVNGSIGFYVNAAGSDVAYRLVGRKLTYLSPPTSVSTAATGVNRHGAIVGWSQTSVGITSGWLLKHGHFQSLQFPGSLFTQIFAINDRADIVGSYTAQDGRTHGFIAASPYGAGDWQSIDNPHAGSGAPTVATGINNKRAIVGWYIDERGNTQGFIASAP